MTGVYRLADLNIGVESQFEAVHEMCRGYRAEVGPGFRLQAMASAPDFGMLARSAAQQGVNPLDFAVSTTPADIEFERAKSAAEDRAEGHAVREYKDPYLETLAVYRKIAERLPEYGGFLIHGSCIAVDGQAYLFTAKSGTGKSTHARLWMRLLGEKAQYINDDKPLVRFRDGVPLIYGTPWDGKHHLSANASAPLRAVCILERSAENHIKKISAAEAYPMLVQQTYRPADPLALAKTLQLLDRLAKCVSFYRLGCNMEPQAAEVSYAAMRGANHET